ncbi:hypothetical protein RJ639_005501 [Escallonia herrerae]|uniref:Uncharacterized protein n=1 Tax=Escallonia herrerae TaxID=1293975 RepID=A0AA88VV47_9ASTE|nr:hypothetical protein RJ639_005501 [Escallonia herrerae]
MENLISLVNRLQGVCTALGDHGEECALPTLWDALISIVVVGGLVRLRFLRLRRHCIVSQKDQRNELQNKNPQLPLPHYQAAANTVNKRKRKLSYDR